MQNGSLGNKEQKLISLSELSFAEIARMRRERERADVASIQAIQPESTPKQPLLEGEPQESAVIEFRDDVDIETEYYKIPNDLYRIAPLQDPKEHCVYMYLYRLSYGWKRNFCRAGYYTIMKNTSVSSKSSVTRAIEGLVEKRHIIRIEEDAIKKAGTLYRILTPQEILSGVFKMSIVKLNTVKLNISKMSIVKMSIVKLNTHLIQNEYSQIEYSQKTADMTEPCNCIQNEYSQIEHQQKQQHKDNITTTGPELQPIPTKDVFVVVSSSKFFKDLPERTVRKLCKQYGEEKVAEKINTLEEQYSGQKMENPGGLLTDALKNDYFPSERVLRKRKAEELAEIREKERLVEQELLEQAEKLRERILAEKTKLVPEERIKLREKALEEIKNIKGIKEEFVTEILIEAKENELIGKQLGIELPK